MAQSEQATAMAAVLEWYRGKNRKQVFRLFGPAGTGKSTLAKAIASQIGSKVLFGAFSGKAASVLRAKGCEAADTIHRLIYQAPHKDSKDRLTFVLNEASPVRSADLVIIDEVSMVDGRLGKDLERFDRPILVLGDRHQLPPVEGKGYFMRGPADVELKTVLRQREDNPIIKLATAARSGTRTLSVDSQGASAIIRGIDLDVEKVLRADQVLVGLNETRHRFNARIRELLGYPHGIPTQGDKLVCLKNNPSKGLFNGDICFVIDILDLTDKFVTMKIRPEAGSDRTIEVRVRREFFVCKEEDLPQEMRQKEKNQFAFGNVLTVHKAQGSEWKSVVLFDESDKLPKHRSEWLYTGITRASESVVIVR
ncbi:ATP-dependent DNA helicase [Bradyrhizobium liaoningense]|uniref:ATP-dependent DNA helicase n=1 Tax=Bradyrhizobium liaoningense TaxID=43992 RepID=UPI0032DF16CE